MGSVPISRSDSPLNPAVVRGRLSAVRDLVIGLSDGAPDLAPVLRELACDVESVLEFHIGWTPPPLTAHDLAWFAASDPGALTEAERARLAMMNAGTL